MGPQRHCPCAALHCPISKLRSCRPCQKWDDSRKPFISCSKLALSCLPPSIRSSKSIFRIFGTEHEEREIECDRSPSTVPRSACGVKPHATPAANAARQDGPSHAPSESIPTELDKSDLRFEGNPVSKSHNPSQRVTFLCGTQEPTKPLQHASKSPERVQLPPGLVLIKPGVVPLRAARVHPIPLSLFRTGPVCSCIGPGVPEHENF